MRGNREFVKIACFLLSFFSAYGGFGPLWSTPGSAKEATELFPIVQNEKWGYIDRTGTIVIEPQFDWAEEFSEDLAAVKIEGACGYIDKTGKIAIEPQFDDCENFSEGLAVVGIKGMWSGYIDKAGAVVLQPKFESARPFSEGLAYVEESLLEFYQASAVAKASGAADIIAPRKGYIDRTGKFVIELKSPESAASLDFSEGLVAVTIGVKSGYIDKTGKIVIKPQFDQVGRFSEGLALVGNYTIPILDASGKFGYIDKTGRFVIKPPFGVFMSPGVSFEGEFSEGLAPMAAMYGKWGYIDKTGKFVIKPQFDEALPFSEGVAPVLMGDLKNGKWGYIDNTGKFVIDPQFDGYAITTEDGGKFSHGLAKIDIGTYRREEWGNIQKWGYIDKKGQYVWTGEQVFRFKKPRKESVKPPSYTPEQLAYAYSTKGKYKEAIDILEDLIRKSDHSSEYAWDLLAYACRKSGEWERLLEIAKLGIEKDPQSAPAYHEAGFAAGQIYGVHSPESRAYYEKYLELEPDTSKTAFVKEIFPDVGESHRANGS